MPMLSCTVALQLLTRQAELSRPVADSRAHHIWGPRTSLRLSILAVSYIHLWAHVQRNAKASPIPSSAASPSSCRHHHLQYRYTSLKQHTQRQS
ncbi:hypothetical protein M431DRAFT_417017 [Trichoderma harzianum CBS 226.95]|uniref:Uncharacterized protein n=1 Tax=Trichoderma harzianum CBS 226.95 TaxID=983964 RepID=A0A2T4AG92_TRIHA|nr:hypothetical protein M431DRAFT_417017 [Trichoderma harzianum CBS 226.95]PTB56087.1 hypothetical protein M431DRAFT_417017 [Trichoderma harzianum CBS 226.95]